MTIWRSFFSGKHIETNEQAFLESAAWVIIIYLFILRQQNLFVRIPRSFEGIDVRTLLHFMAVVKMSLVHIVRRGSFLFWLKNDWI